MSVRCDPGGVERRHLREAVDFRGAHVLEIGCGAGRLSWRYAGAARAVTAFDTRFERLQQALADRPRFWQARVQFLQADGLNLPFPRERFDIALLAWSL